MWGGICRSYTKGRSFGISHIMLGEFDRRVELAGCDETKRQPNHVGYQINLWQNAHGPEEGPDLIMHPRSQMLKSYKWIEYYFSFPVDTIMKSGDPLRAWLETVVRAMHMIEKKSGIVFLALKDDKAFIDGLVTELRSDPKYRSDRFPAAEPTDIIL